MTRQAYTSIVTGWAQSAIGAALTGAVVIVTIGSGGSPWIAALVGAVMIVVVAHVSTVRLGVGGGAVTLRQGPWPVAPVRLVPATEISTAERVDLTWAQTFGLGARPGRLLAGTTRFTVRPGPTLQLRLRSGEVVRVSTPDPQTACTLVRATTTQERA